MRGHHPQGHMIFGWPHDHMSLYDKYKTLFPSFFHSKHYMMKVYDERLVMVYDKTTSKSHVSLVTWSCVVSWQMQRFISLIPKTLQILVGWWFMEWCHQTKNQINLSNMFFFIFSFSFYLKMYLEPNIQGLE